jgi:hypothetical protein
MNKQKYHWSDKNGDRVMGLIFKNETDWFQIAINPSCPDVKRKKAITKIKDHDLLIDLIDHLSNRWSKDWDSNHRLIDYVLGVAAPAMTIDDISRDDLGLRISAYMVKSIINQDVLCWLAEHGNVNSWMGSKNVRELVAERVYDPDRKAELSREVQAEKKARAAEHAAFLTQERADRALKEKMWKENRLCPKCGGGAKYEIRTRRVDPTMGAESKNLEPVEVGVCLKCGHSFTARGPEEVQALWRSRYD